MNLDEEGALFDSCEPAKPMAPLFLSSGHPLPTPDDIEQQGVEMLPCPLRSSISMPVNASLSCYDAPFSPAASPIPSPRASPRLSPAPSTAGSSPPLPSPECAPAQSHIIPQPSRPCLSLSPSPELAHAQSRITPPPHHLLPLPSPRPSNPPASALCDPTPPPSVRQTRKRANAGPPAAEPKPKKSKGAGSTSRDVSSTRKSLAKAELSKGCRPRNGAVAGATPMTSKS